MDCPQRGQGPLCAFYTLSLAPASPPLWWTAKSRVPAFPSLVAPAVPWLGIRDAQGCGLGRVPFPQPVLQAVCLGLSSFSLFFLPFLSCSESLYPKAAELGRVSSAGVTFAFELCVPSSIHGFTKRKNLRNVLPTTTFSSIIPWTHWCCPDCFLLGLEERLEQLFGC